MRAINRVVQPVRWMWTYQMRRMLFMCCLVLGTGSLKSAGVKLPRSVPYLKPVFSPRSTTTKFAFVHVIDDLKKEAKQRHLDEPEAYWLASSGVADMGMCVLAAQMTNLRLHNASGDHVIITRHVDVQDPRVMTSRHHGLPRGFRIHIDCSYRNAS